MARTQGIYGCLRGWGGRSGRGRLRRGCDLDVTGLRPFDQGVKDAFARAVKACLVRVVAARICGSEETEDLVGI